MLPNAALATICSGTAYGSFAQSTPSVPMTDTWIRTYMTRQKAPLTNSALGRSLLGFLYSGP